ncbi:MAG: TrkA C-terminal domain-containing protein, partial [Chloroflexota bacterium]
YRTALSGNVRQVRGLRAGGLLMEVEVSAEAVMSGQKVSQIPWPRDAVLVAIERGDAVLVPRGDMTIDAGDRLSIFADHAARAALESLLASRREEPAEEPAAEPEPGGAD